MLTLPIFYVLWFAIAVVFNVIICGWTLYLFAAGDRRSAWACIIGAAFVAGILAWVLTPAFAIVTLMRH